MEDACSVAPWESAWAPAATCSEPPATCSALWSMFLKTADISFNILYMESESGLKSPTYKSWDWLVMAKLPAAISLSPQSISLIILLMESVMRRVASDSLPVSSLECMTGTCDFKSPSDSFWILSVQMWMGLPIFLASQ